MQKYKIVTDYNPVGCPKWKEFVQANDHRNIFHTPEFHSFISNTDNIRPIAMAAFNEDGSLAGILSGMLQREGGVVKRMLSSRLIVTGGPLTASGKHDVTDVLLKALVRQYRRRAVYIEFRNLFSMNEDKDVFQRNGFSFAEHLNFLVNTENREQAVKRINSGKSRQIKKGLKNEARIVTQASLIQVQQFYDILKSLYKTKIKKPLPPWAFFEQFFHHPEIGRYLLVEYKGEIVGGTMCLIYDDNAIYEWYIAGEDRKYKDIYPSVLATWALIDYALNNGIKQFDFLGAGKPDQDYGVREFKSGFGGELVSYGRFMKVNSQLLYFIGKTGLSILSRLK